MPNTRRATEAVDELNSIVEPISGRLGIPLDGVRQVEVANRPGFVYVRLRDNTNELIQAFNESVSTVYDLPVLVDFKQNRYVVVGRDTARYSSWGSDSSYLPAHGSQHSLLANQYGGGDPVFVDGRQMMPGALYPSGTLGGPNVLVSEFLFRNKLGNWLYIGNTGTVDLNGLRPNGSNARLVLVCLDYTSGGFVLLTGTTFSSTLTGTSQIFPYLPTTNLEQVPLGAVRIVSGTTSIGWDNIYDARLWIDSGYLTGSTGGGSSSAAGDTGEIQYNDGSDNFAATPRLLWNTLRSSVDIGDFAATILTTQYPNAGINILNKEAPVSGIGSGLNMFVFGNGTSFGPYVRGFRSGGTPTGTDIENWTPVVENDRLISLFGDGYAGSDGGGGYLVRGGRLSLRANENWYPASSYGSKWLLTVVKNGLTAEFTSVQSDGYSLKSYLPFDLPEVTLTGTGTPDSGLGRLSVNSANQHLIFTDSSSIVTDLMNSLGNIPLLTSDPSSPEDGELWLLRSTTGNIADGTPIGMLLALTYTGNTGTIAPLQLSVNDDGTIRRLQFA